jgi:hypothetical protein
MSKEENETEDSISLFLEPNPTLQEYYLLGNMYVRTIDIVGTIKWKKHTPGPHSPRYISRFEVRFAFPFTLVFFTDLLS